jgi:1-acyl-sn-glycerol-3-phosphate acyltransferase
LCGRAPRPRPAAGFVSVVSGLRVPVRRIVRAGGFAAITSGLLAPFALRTAFTRADERTNVRNRWVRRWSDALLSLFSIAVDASAPLPKPPGRGRLVVANHRSTIDIAVLLRTFGGRMVSRADLSGWPLVGIAATSVGTIFVDRESTASGVTTIRLIRQALEAGDTVCLFPEGTTFEGDLVRPFHAGAFVSALRTGAEIVPVGIAYERGSGAAFVGEPFLKHLQRLAGAGPTRVVARAGEPFRVGEKMRAAELSARTHAAVQALVNEARRVCDERDQRDPAKETETDATRSVR